MPVGSDSTVAEPHPFRSPGLPPLARPSVRFTADRLPAGAGGAVASVDCTRCGGRGAVYIPALLREVSCPDCP